MSGPGNPPLKVTDGPTSIRPTRTITFDAAEFTVTDNGNGNARIDIDAGGSADLTDTYIGFGSASNLLTGSANFTFTEETGGNGPTVLLTGDKPIFQMRDDTAATLYRTEFVQSGASMFIFHRDSTGTDRELLRLSNSYIRINDDGLDIDVKMEGENVDHLFSLDAAQDNIGIATSPNSNTLLHISDDGTKANTVRIESTDNDTSVGPVLDLRRNNADGTATDGDNLGVIQFSGLDDGGGSETYTRIRATAADTDATNPEGALEILNLYNGTEVNAMRIGPIGDAGSANNAVDINPDSVANCDFRVRGDGVTNLLYVDGSTDKIGFGEYPAGGGPQVQVDEDLSCLRPYVTSNAATLTLTDAQCHNKVVHLTYDTSAQAITMPTAVSGMCVTLVRQQASNAPTVVAASGEKINGTAAPSTLTMGAQYSVMILHGVAGTGWIAYEPAVAS